MKTLKIKVLILILLNMAELRGFFIHLSTRQLHDCYNIKFENNIELYKYIIQA